MNRSRIESRFFLKECVASVTNQNVVVECSVKVIENVLW